MCISKTDPRLLAWFDSDLSLLLNFICLSLQFNLSGELLCCTIIILLLLLLLLFYLKEQGRTQLNDLDLIINPTFDSAYAI